MQVSATEIGIFKRCRRQWDYQSDSRMILKPIVRSTALNLGTIVHQTMAAWCYDPQADPVLIFKDTAAKTIAEASKLYMERVGTDMSNDEWASLLEVATLGEAMITNYKARWDGPIPRGYDLVSAECTLSIPFGGHTFQGTLDGLVSKGSKVYVLERKTYGYRPKREILEMNNQFLSYLALARLNDVDAEGIIYDGMWKRAEPPKGSKLEDLFYRDLFLRPDEEIDEFIRDTEAVIIDMTTNPYIYPNRRWEGCYDCDYEKLCRAESRGEDVEYILKHYYQERK